MRLRVVSENREKQRCRQEFEGSCEQCMRSAKSFARKLLMEGWPGAWIVNDRGVTLVGVLQIGDRVIWMHNEDGQFVRRKVSWTEDKVMGAVRLRDRRPKWETVNYLNTLLDEADGGERSYDPFQ